MDAYYEYDFQFLPFLVILKYSLKMTKQSLRRSLLFLYSPKRKDIIVEKYHNATTLSKRILKLEAFSA